MMMPIVKLTRHDLATGLPAEDIYVNMNHVVSCMAVDEEGESHTILVYDFPTGEVETYVAVLETPEQIYDAIGVRVATIPMVS